MYHFSERRYASKNVCVKDIGSRASMVTSLACYRPVSLVYGTSKLPNFYRTDFKHGLYCWRWLEMNPFEHPVGGWVGGGDILCFLDWILPVEILS